LEFKRPFLKMDPEIMHHISELITDENLRHTLNFGVGMHHAGLSEGDRKIVEDLFVKKKIQVLVTTSTLAWGVNFPARLVIVKGTEFFDPKIRRYVDFPLTDLL
jgi:activating signal cointegrator complex subunit 3